MLDIERKGKVTLDVRVFPRHELFYVDLLGNRIAAASALNWEQFIDQIRCVDSDIVVSPELMTFAGQALNTAEKSQALVEQRVEEVITVSKNHPDTKYVLGTVSYNYSRPANSAIVITNGQIITQTDKRSAQTIEIISGFYINYQSPPFLIPGTEIGVMICSDLQNSNWVVKTGEKNHYVHPEAQAIIMMSCWSVGGNRHEISKIGADLYYNRYLQQYAYDFMFLNSRINQLLVVDRLLTTSTGNPSPSRPFNYLFTRT